MTPNQPERYWLLLNTVPTGPFTVAEIHVALHAGRATWQTLASPCGVADTPWQPLLQTPGIGPILPPPTTSVTPSTNPVAEEPTSTVPTTTRQEPVAAEPKPVARPAASAPQHPVVQVLGWLGAIVLVGGLYWATKSPRSATTPEYRPSGTGETTLAKLGQLTPPPFPNKEPTAPVASEWHVGIKPSSAAVAARFVGAWRWTGSEYASTFAFEPRGTFTYSMTSAEERRHGLVATSEAYGRWSVVDGTLLLEFTGANTPALNNLFRGRTARSVIKFSEDNTVQLSGIEGDDVARLYQRIR